MKTQIYGAIFMISIFSSLFSNAADLKVGDPAPKVAAKNEEGALVNIDQYYVQGYTLVYFYPKADTPGCTAQSCSLRDHYAELSKLGVRVIGVSTDSVEDQKKFKQKHRLPFELISDKEKKVAKAFGVSVNLGFASRQAFLIRDGKIVWLDRSASTKEQADDVLKVLSANKN